MDYFPKLLDGGFEGLHFFTDASTGLRALIALHSTRLGPGLGGTRALATYGAESEAVLDVMRLARGMTFKAALAGLPHGGGKAVIMLPQGSFDRARLFESFGRAVETLGGRYITTEDSGTSPADMVYVRKTTRHVAGLEGASGDPSPVTAFGVARGIEAVARFALGRDDCRGLKVSVLGIGHVGYALCEELHRRGATLFVSDVRKEAVERAVQQFGATGLSEQELLRADADVYAPCALGGAINDQTLPLLRVKAVAGAANNQLLEPRHGEELARRGILYAPDYAINAGGLINVAQERVGYDRDQAYGRAAGIYDTLSRIFTQARESGLRPEQVADRLVEERLTS